MYSLYRAWFGAEESYPRLDRLSPPDIVVRVGNQGEHQFVAHKEVLATHSGYMKALLATNSPGIASSANTSIDSSITSISVSSVGGEAFAPLLNYMYTGRLEVTSENIYSILLATHLLHMPGALEECRRALLRLRAPPALSLSPPTSSQSANILRPVPNRLVALPFCWPQPGPIYPPTSIGLPHINHLQLPPTLPVLSQPMLHESGTVPYSIQKPSSPSFGQQRPVASRSSSPNARTQQSAEDEGCKTLATKTRSPSPSETSEHVSVTELEQPGRSQVRSRSSNSRRSETRTSGDVIFDVACCDGPIKFHRVLNENYAAGSVGAPPKQPRACLEEDNTSSENDENGRPENEGRLYTCKYCRSTFKSQYCYKKHARRHLFASDVDAQQRTDERNKEDKFADLNVQYYPCKICGSKFPSYYFVHKHRKLCHSNVDDSASGGSVAEDIGPTQLTESVDSK